MKGILRAILFVSLLTNLDAFLQKLFSKELKYSFKGIGWLYCGNEPSPPGQTRVALIKAGSLGQRTALVLSTQTDSHGHFSLMGSTTHKSVPKLKMEILTDCNNERIKDNCQRKLTVILPKKYLNSQKGFNLGTLNLETKFVKEKWLCSSKIKPVLPISPKSETEAAGTSDKCTTDAASHSEQCGPSAPARHDSSSSSAETVSDSEAGKPLIGNGGNQPPTKENKGGEKSLFSWAKNPLNALLNRNNPNQ